jgi:hypothetical protein
MERAPKTEKPMEATDFGDEQEVYEKPTFKDVEASFKRIVSMLEKAKTREFDDGDLAIIVTNLKEIEEILEEHVEDES